MTKTIAQAVEDYRQAQAAEQAALQAARDRLAAQAETLKRIWERQFKTIVSSYIKDSYDIEIDPDCIACDKHLNTHTEACTVTITPFANEPGRQLIALFHKEQSDAAYTVNNFGWQGCKNESTAIFYDFMAALAYIAP